MDALADEFMEEMCELSKSSGNQKISQYR